MKAAGARRCQFPLRRQGPGLKPAAKATNANVKAWLKKDPRFHLHFTHTSFSWLNQVERFFSLITTERIRRGVFTFVAKLETPIRDDLKPHNASLTPFIWKASVVDILSKVACARRELAPAC